VTTSENPTNIVPSRRMTVCSCVWLCSEILTQTRHPWRSCIWLPGADDHSSVESRWYAASVGVATCRWGRQRRAQDMGGDHRKWNPMMRAKVAKAKGRQWRCRPLNSKIRHFGPVAKWLVLTLSDDRGNFLSFRASAVQRRPFRGRADGTIKEMTDRPDDIVGRPRQSITLRTF
jgi:hypothetical protein